MSEIDALEVRVLRLQDGDEIVLTTAEHVSREYGENLKRKAEERWPGYPVTVLSGLELSVLRKDEA